MLPSSRVTRVTLRLKQRTAAQIQTWVCHQSCHPRRINRLSEFGRRFSTRAPPRSEAKSRRGQDEDTQSAKESEILHIVRGDHVHGVTVDRAGRLQIKGGESARAKQWTALLLTRVSPSLSKYDFLRILDNDRCGAWDAAPGQLEAGEPAAVIQRKSW